MLIGVRKEVKIQKKKRGEGREDNRKNGYREKGMESNWIVCKRRHRKEVRENKK